ncbi:OmpW family outer membrane protein, partial [Pseudomonas syringae]
MHKHLLRASLVALALTAPVAAHAYEPGDFIVRAGVAHVQPNEDSGEVRLDGTKVSGTKATVDGENQLGLTFAYMLTQHVGIELLA